MGRCRKIYIKLILVMHVFVIRSPSPILGPLVIAIYHQCTSIDNVKKLIFGGAIQS